LADDPTERSDPAQPGEPPPAATEPPAAQASAERSWRGLVVGLALGIAMVLLIITIAVFSRGGGGDAKATSTTLGVTTVAAPGGQAASSTTVVAPTDPAGPSTTRRPTPLPIVAADDRRVVVLDQSGAAARTLFDLGSSSSSDQVPPIVGGVALSNDGKFAYFDVVGSSSAGSLKRVPVAGGTTQDLGRGVAPMPSPDGSILALIEAPEPDTPATLVLRPQNGGNEQRFELTDGTCGNISWAPSRREVAVDLCSGGEPTTVAIIDIASAGMRQLKPPEGTTWSVPAFKPDGTLTLVEQRERDAAVVALTPDRGAVATTILRRPSTTIATIDWSAPGDLLVCDYDGIVLEAIGGAKPQQVATGFTAAAW